MLSHGCVVLQKLQERTGSLWKERKAQDLIEYALMAGFVAVAVAFLFTTSIAPNISTIMGKVSRMLDATPN